MARHGPRGVFRLFVDFQECYTLGRFLLFPDEADVSDEPEDATPTFDPHGELANLARIPKRRTDQFSALLARNCG
jgi:hypothetical protein